MKPNIISVPILNNIVNKNTQNRKRDKKGERKSIHRNGETISEGKGSRVKRTRNTLVERRAREPTYTFITTRKREGGGEEKEGKKNMGERRKREREREFA